MNRFRKYLSIKGLLNIANHLFESIEDQQLKRVRQNPITLADCLMSALAMFSLKYPSLLQFDQDLHNIERLKHNLRTLYNVKNAPSDTYMREKLDEIDTDNLRKAYKQIFFQLQRGKELEQFQYIDGYYMCAIDGTGMFESNEVFCDNCCIKEHKNGTKSYYHQMFCGAIVHPHQKIVIPFAPEPIIKSDGSKKNDCEINAAKRFIANLRREHPHLKLIITSDSLLSKGPFIKICTENKLRYILIAKPADHKTLFEFVESICHNLEKIAHNRTIYKYRYVNNVPLNHNNDIQTNFLEQVEIDRNGRVKRFSWVTDMFITPENIEQIAKGGRSRWKIENETFNTLKNRGYQFEHNFGHGRKNLTTVFAMLMMLAFMIDQAQELCCDNFKQALVKKISRIRLWDSLRSLFSNFLITDWDDMWNSIAFGHQDIHLKPMNSS